MHLLNKITSNKKIKKIGINLKFDIKQLMYHYNLEWYNISDCMINEMIKYQGFQRQIKYSMEALTKRYLKIKYEKLIYQITGFEISKDIRTTYSNDKPLSFEQIYYAAADIYITYKIFMQQSKWLYKRIYSLTSKLENKFTIVLAAIELAGMPFSVSKWLENEKTYATNLVILEQELRETIKEEFPTFENINFNSSKQVAELFREMNIPVDYVDKHGESKTSVAETHVQNYKHLHRFIPKYIEYKHTHKLVSTYGKKFLKYVHPITNRLHSEYYQILATGRISSSNPNLQNIPNEEKRSGFRQCFATTDTVLIVADYSSQESRVLADAAKESFMINLFRSADPDMHSLTASRMFGIPIGKVKGTKYRQIGKVLNFSIAYGASASKIAEVFQVPLEEGQDFINRFFKAYPKLKPYFNLGKIHATTKGYIEIDSLTKRRVLIPNFNRFKSLENLLILYNKKRKNPPKKILSEYYKIKGEIERNSQNYKIQGTSGHITKVAGILIYEAIKKYNAKIVNMIHDEIVVECSKKDSVKVTNIIKRYMELAGKLFVKTVPMPVSCKTSLY